MTVSRGEGDEMPMDAELSSDRRATWPARLGRALGCVAVAHLLWVGLTWTYLAASPGVDQGPMPGSMVIATMVVSLVGVVGGSVLASHLGGWRRRRGAAAGAAFLIAWLLAAPILLLALEPLLPERPPLFGLALGTQLAVLLPWRGRSALLVRLLPPVVVDLMASVLASPGGSGVGSDIAGGPIGAVGWLALAVAAVWLLERRAGEPPPPGDDWPA